MSSDPLVIATSQAAWSTFAKKVDANHDGQVTVDETRAFLTAATKGGVKTDQWVDDVEAKEGQKLFTDMGISKEDAERLTYAAQTVFDHTTVTFDDANVKRAPTKTDFTQFEGDRSGETFFVRGKQYHVGAGGEIRRTRFSETKGWEYSPVPPAAAKEIAQALRQLLASGSNQVTAEEASFLMTFVDKADPK